MLRDITAIRRIHPGLRVALAGLTLLSIASLARVVQMSASPQGGLDLYAYWFQGHVLREGRNPYEGAPQDSPPRQAARYLDGVVTTGPPVPLPNMTRVPFITAPLALLLFQLSWLSWPVAKWLFLAVNLALVVCLPRLMLRSFPASHHLAVEDRWLVCLAFYASLATRLALWLGQTTPLVFALMLAALLLKESSWPLAGICLGLAVSKYHVALPLVILLLLSRRRRNVQIVATALLVQLVGAVLISLWSGDAVWRVIQAYVASGQVVARGTRGLGWSLASLVSPRYQAVAAALLLSAAALGLLWLWRRWSSLRWRWAPMPAYHLWVIVLLLALNVTYHGIYDMFMAFAFLPLGLFAARRAQMWRLTSTQSRLVYALSLLLVVASILPGSTVDAVLSDAATRSWLRFRSQSTTLVALLALASTGWLLSRWLSQPPNAQASPREDVG